MKTLPKLSLILLALGFLAAPFFMDSASPACQDGIDNDYDGKIDYPADPGCYVDYDTSEYGPVGDPECDDNTDNDGDGRTDYRIGAPWWVFGDLQCTSPWDDSEFPDPACQDGIDNDGDGLTDYPADGGCYVWYDTSEYGPVGDPECDDNTDNDGDGRTDYRISRWAFGDPQCTSPWDDSEFPEPACQDGIDNDGDGFIDWPNDPGCYVNYDTTELGTTSCDDGWDNDGDLLFDYPADPGCTSPADNSEHGPVGDPECDDGIDNDGDGTFDYKRIKSWIFVVNDPSTDLDCDSPWDDSESSGSENSCRPWDTSCKSKPVLSPPEESPVTEIIYSPSVDLTAGGTVLGNAYQTQATIHWSVVDGCDCTTGLQSWWDGPGGTVNSAGDTTVTIRTSGGTTYALTCNKQPSCNAAAGTVSDSVTITPLWDSKITSFTGPASKAANQTVYLDYSLWDIKSCVKSWDGGTLTLSDGNPQTGTLPAGTISAPTDFTLNCLGFDGLNRLSNNVHVGFFGSPQPFFSINSINLIIVGPGSGGRSTSATVSITKSRDYKDDIELSAASQSLKDQGAKLCLNATDGTTCSQSVIISCNNSSDRCDKSAQFWVETAKDLTAGDYDIVVTADPQPPSDLASETKTIPLRVRRFVPAFEEI